MSIANPAALALLPLLALSALAQDAPPPVKVFLLAGQSNMEGKGAVDTLDHLGDDPVHGDLLQEIQEPDGSWVVRDDVFVWFLGRSGRLTVGFGSKGGRHGDKIGPELGFGIAVGDALEEPVLLIKTAWGGKDVASDFLPPSAGGPGPFYQEMVQLTKEVLADIGTFVPGYAGQGHELAGFVWFQGWNDMIDADKTAKYPERMAHLIDDLRAEFEVPDLPVVIGELGVNGDEAKGDILRFRKAQEAVAEMPRFSDTVRLVRTAPYYDRQAHELYEAGVWKGEDKERFYAIASDRPYHYLGSGKTYFLMGRDFGKEMVAMLER